MLRQAIRRQISTKVSSRVIGIDLGTTNSAVAYIRDSNDKRSATIIENESGQRTTPSVVAFDLKSTTRDNVIVGTPAKRQALLNSENTFFATKRLIGRSFDDAEVQRDIPVMPFKIVKADTGNGQASLRGYQ